MDYSSDSNTVFGDGNPTVQAAYEKTLLTWLERYKRYPHIAKCRGQEDMVTLDFTIDKDGNILSYTLSEPSKYKVLNKAVERMLKRALPLPQELIKGKTRFNYIVPVNFELK